MCGRYLFDPMITELAEYYRLASLLGEIKQGEIFPTDMVPILGADKNGKIKVLRSSWGFTGFKKGQRIINARSETVLEKALFAHDFRWHRCVFPMGGFYEWDQDKTKLLFHEEANALYIGGFMREHQGLIESIILTTEPNETVAPIHDRMPLIIEKSAIRSWLTDFDFAVDYLNQEMTAPLTIQAAPTGSDLSS